MADFPIRPFADCVAAFRAVAPSKLKKQASPHYAGTEAWAWDDLEEWPERPPIESLHLVPDAPSDVLEAPQGFLDWANFGNAVGTWNVTDEEALWKGSPKCWILLLLELSREEDWEHGGGVDLVMACWRVEEGVAVGITELTDAGRARLLPVMGLASWPDDFEPASLWYGE
jgi:hypothetical protein